MRKMKDVPLQDRPREKIEKKGASALSDTELMEAIIGRGTRCRDVREIAKDVCGILKDRRDIRYEDIRAIGGIGPTRASQIMACFEMGRRYFAPEANGGKVTKPDDILPFVAHLRDKRQEHFICITLNGAGEVLGNRVITVGLLNHSLVHPREVFADAITDRAASIICVHNHPSGSLEPSSQDIAITAQAQGGWLPRWNPACRSCYHHENRAPEHAGTRAGLTGPYHDPTRNPSMWKVH